MVANFLAIFHLSHFPVMELLELFINMSPPFTFIVELSLIEFGMDTPSVRADKHTRARLCPRFVDFNLKKNIPSNDEVFVLLFAFFLFFFFGCCAVIFVSHALVLDFV